MLSAFKSLIIEQIHRVIKYIAGRNIFQSRDGGEVPGKIFLAFIITYSYNAGKIFYIIY